MWRPHLLGVIGTCGQDPKIGIELHRIRIDDDTTKAFSQRKCQRRFASGRRPADHHKGAGGNGHVYFAVVSHADIWFTETIPEQKEGPAKVHYLAVFSSSTRTDATIAEGMSLLDGALSDPEKATTLSDGQAFEIKVAARLLTIGTR